MKKYWLHLFILVLAIVNLSSLLLPRKVLAGEGGPYPPKPEKVWAKSGPLAGEVTLYWQEVPYANRYAVAYGETSGKYLYGADNIGGEKSTSYTVKALTPGKKYYFRLAAARDKSSSPLSEEVSAVAQTGTVVGGGISLGTPSISKSAYLQAVSGPTLGQVTLTIWPKDDVDNYHLVYGDKAKEYQYGALNIGKVSRFVVKSLSAGKRYYFAIVPVKGNQALYTTDPVSAVAYSPPPVVEEAFPVKLPSEPSPEQLEVTPVDEIPVEEILPPTEAPVETEPIDEPSEALTPLDENPPELPE